MTSNRPIASGPVALLAMGTAFIVAVAAVIGFAMAMATGAFAGYRTVDAGVISTGSQIRAGAPVKFRQVTVGRVSAILSPGRAGHPISEVALEIQGDRMGTIPSNVTSRIAPSSLFGENVVELVPPATPDPTGLQDHGAIRADDSSEAVALTTMFESLRRIVHVLQPAKLDTVLGTLAEALGGRGPELGRMAAILNSQLGSLEQNMPTLRADITAVTHVVAGLSDATPDLLSAVRDTVVVSRDVLHRREELGNLITGAGSLVSQTNRLLMANRSNLACALSVAPGAFSILASGLPSIRAGLSNGILALDHFISTFSKGPWGAVSVELSSTLGKGIVAPPPYSTRIHYPGGPGPSCAGGAR